MIWETWSIRPDAVHGLIFLRSKAIEHLPVLRRATDATLCLERRQFSTREKHIYTLDYS